MKRTLALLLSCVMLLTIAVGCKKKETPEELTNARIAIDLTSSASLYSYNYIAGTPAISGMTFARRDETDDRASLSLSAKAAFSNGDVQLSADMEYRREGARWKLESVTITQSELTITDAPDQASVLMELANYISVTGGALAIYGEEYHSLKFNLQAANWEMEYEEGAETALLKTSYKSDALTFAGSYTLTVGDKGWSIETDQRADGRYHPLMRLSSLKKK